MSKLTRGLAWQRLANVGVTITANVFLNWLLIPVWGAVGAAAASSLAYLPYCLLNLIAADKAFSAGRGAIGVMPRLSASRDGVADQESD